MDELGGGSPGRLALMAMVMIGLFVAGLVVWAVVIFNRLIRLRNQVREGWSGIEVQLKRRHDLVPNLVRVVGAYQRHERELLEEVTAQRTAAVSANGPSEASGAERGLTEGIAGLLALVEAYPELKADGSFRDLHKTLVEIEDDLQYARRYYNGSVRDMNNVVESFPSLLVARAGGFGVNDYFEVENAVERVVPRVETE
jgi:LemA protein